jgi:hypothetical protein
MVITKLQRLHVTYDEECYLIKDKRKDPGFPNDVRKGTNVTGEKGSDIMVLAAYYNNTVITRSFLTSILLATLTFCDECIELNNRQSVVPEGLRNGSKGCQKEQDAIHIWDKGQEITQERR